MASNFKIVVHRNSENVHLKLTGDFDGTSADELLNTLKENCADVRKIFIHTSGLRKMYPFGQELLQKSLYIMNGRPTSLVFTALIKQLAAANPCAARKASFSFFTTQSFPGSSSS